MEVSYKNEIYLNSFKRVDFEKNKAEVGRRSQLLPHKILTLENPNY